MLQIGSCFFEFTGRENPPGGCISSLESSALSLVLCVLTSSAYKRAPFPPFGDSPSKPMSSTTAMSFNAMDEIFPSQPDAILGTGREQLPGKYQSVFLPGDLVLFQNPDSDAPFLPGNLFSSPPSHVQDWMVFCDYCNLDKIIGFTILAYIAQKLLPSALYNHLYAKFEDFLAFMDIWRTIHVAGKKLPNQYRYTNPDLEFRPISNIAARVQLQEGWLILRLQRYPDPFEWPRLAWLNKLYHTCRDYQRSEAAAQWAFEEMQGELDGILYSISELEEREDAKSLVWLPVPPPL
ncbi:hypothetical protein QBC34DRAFT_113328 [Podospora aff. communis PSN243]|uniref:Uncharacterized protein n=1 Tax=Podospora aff. communis PSN243 TaxID=3040156 RepID=A0AAV9GM47_9PEZI|nr:hypothetical protein QBC34DRAFT_113328 [Podospora aff. communis PSN243]